MSVKTDLKINIPDWAKKDRIYHVFFWVGLYVAFIIVDPNPLSAFVFIKELVNIFFYIIIVYFNLFYLIPTYLRGTSSGIHYAIALVLSAIVLTPIKTLVFYLLFTNQPGVQGFFIAKQGTIFFSTLFYGAVSTIFQIILDWQKGTREKIELQHKNTESELKYPIAFFK